MAEKKRQNEKRNELRLYKVLSKFIADWLDEENKQGKKPFQSEIIGALDMLKMDFYLAFNNQTMFAKNLKEMLGALKGKTMQIDENNAITIQDISEEQKG